MSDFHCRCVGEYCRHCEPDDYVAPKKKKSLNDMLKHGFYVVRSSEGKGLPARIRNMSIEQIRKIVVKDWKDV